jgi:4-hydroxybenzoate polyprenyltransferase
MMRYLIIKPFLGLNGFSLQLDGFHFFLLVLTTVLIAAAGYIINDYFDVRTDRINKPDKVVIDKTIPRRYAIGLHTGLSITGILIGTYLSWHVGVLPLSLLFMFCSGMLWFYSTTYKRQLLIGNLVVSFMTGGVPLLVAIYEIPLLNKEYGEIMIRNQVSFNYIFFWIAGFSFFAFLTNFIREIIKDTEDFEGDNAYGMNTIPIYFGIKYTRVILVTLIIFCIVSLLLLMRHIIYSTDRIDYYTALYFSLALVLPFFILLIRIINAKNKTDYHNASSLLKFIMLAGIMYAFVVRYIVLYQIN